MTLAVLVPVLLIGLGVAAVVIFALIGFRKWWRMLDAEREAALAPRRLLGEQDELISELLYQITGLTLDKEDPLPAKLYNRIEKAQDQYREIERKYK